MIMVKQERIDIIIGPCPEMALGRVVLYGWESSSWTLQIIPYHHETMETNKQYHPEGKDANWREQQYPTLGIIEYCHFPQLHNMRLWTGTILLPSYLVGQGGMECSTSQFHKQSWRYHMKTSVPFFKRSVFCWFGALPLSMVKPVVSKLGPAIW